MIKDVDHLFKYLLFISSFKSLDDSVLNCELPHVASYNWKGIL